MKKVKAVIHVLNPLAGKGRAKKLKENIDKGDYVYMSRSASDAMNFMDKNCRKNRDTCFTVYGGDGTIFKSVNALMRSGCSQNAFLKVVPVGSGNDFVRSFENKEFNAPIDVMKVNDFYSANVINAGFDCNVVRNADKMKKIPIISGKFAYILGVVGELLKKKTMDATVTLKYQDGSEEVIKDELLLVAVANGKWYGGGFMVAPIAEVDDGILDVVIIKNVRTLKFLDLVGDFKKGTYVNKKTGEVEEKFKDYIIYKKCVAVKVEGCDGFCADGEIFSDNSFEVNVVPKAINFITE